MPGPNSAPSPQDRPSPWVAAYPASVPDLPRLPDATVSDLFAEVAERHPARVALAFFGTTVRYRELAAQVQRCAAGLAAIGVRRGDRVALLLPDCPQFVIAFFAVLRLGAVAVPLDPLTAAAELAGDLDDCGAEVALCLDAAFPALSQVPALREVVLTSLADYLPALHALAARLPWTAARRRQPRVRLPAGADGRRFLGLLAARAAPAAGEPVLPADIAVLGYPGGGPGRGAVLTHRALVAAALQYRWWLPDPPAGRLKALSGLPLWRADGLALGLAALVLLGGTLILLPRFELGEVFAALDEHRPTLLAAEPAGYQALLDSARGRAHDLSSVRVCLLPWAAESTSRAGLPPGLAEALEKRTAGRVVTGYAPPGSWLWTHATPPAAGRRPGIGVPVPLTEGRIVGADRVSGSVPVGARGELLVRGPQIFAGYWNRPEESRAVLTDCWLRTGELARMNDSGWFEIVGPVPRPTRRAPGPGPAGARPRPTPRGPRRMPPRSTLEP